MHRARIDRARDPGRGVVRGGGPGDAVVVRHLANRALHHRRQARLPKGRYRVRFENEALGHHTVGECDVLGDGVVDLGSFRVPAPGRLVLTIVDSNGKVMPDVWLLPRALDDLKEGGRPGRSWGACKPARREMA